MAEKQLFRWSQHQINVNNINQQVQAKVDQEGLLRAHGRLEDIRLLPDDMRNPIILPRNHPLAYLLLQHLHERRRHCGYKGLMHEARKKFWIIGLRGMAKHLTKKCIICRKLRTPPLEQLMGQLPSLRVATGLPPFSNTAIDMFGPFHIRLVHDDQSHTPRVGDRQEHRHIPNGFSALCVPARASKYVLVRLRNELCWCTKLP